MSDSDSSSWSGIARLKLDNEQNYGSIQNVSKQKLKSNKHFIPTSTLKAECYMIVTRAILITVQALFEIVPGVLQMQFLGHLPNGAYELAGVGLGRTFATVVGRAQAWGLTTGLFTLIPQCIGAGKMDQISLHAQRAFYVTTITCLLMSIVQLYAGDILVAIGQSSDLRNLINIYCRVFIPNAFLNVWLTIIQRVLQALDYNRDILIAQAISFFGSYPLYYLLIVYFDLQAVGGAIGASILSAIMLIGCTIALVYRGYGFVLKPLPLRVVFIKSQMLEYIYLSLPGLFQNAFEFILIQIAAILAGYVAFSENAISVTVIMGNILSILIAFAFGISNSVNIRVGGYIGRGQILPAKRSAFIGFCVYLFVSIIFAIVFAIFSDDMPYMWTTDILTVEIASKVILYVMIIFNFCLLALQTISGVYRGLAKQKKSAMFVVIGYWMLSFPISLVFLFALDLRSNILYGSLVIWGSLSAGNAFGAISVIFYLLKYIDWGQCVIEAAKRVERGQKIMKGYDQTVNSSSSDVNRNKEKV